MLNSDLGALYSNNIIYYSFLFHYYGAISDFYIDQHNHATKKSNNRSVIQIEVAGVQWGSC